MKPKAKAKELVELYCQLLAIRDYENKNKAKQCALITVEEIINLDIDYNTLDYYWWQEVKQEIELL